MAEIAPPNPFEDLLAKVPSELPILPLRHSVTYPFLVFPLTFGAPRSLRLMEDLLRTELRFIGLVAAKDPAAEEPRPDQIYRVGTVAIVQRVMRGATPLQVVAQGLERFRLIEWTAEEPYLRARIALAPDETRPGVELDALKQTLVSLAKEVVRLSPNVPDEVAALLDQVDSPRYLAYLLAANTEMPVEEAQALLETDTVNEKLQRLLAQLTREREVLGLGQKIRSEARGEIDKAQREYFLRQQLKAIQKELGETDEGQGPVAEYRERLKQATLPEEARREAERELGRLAAMPAQSPEQSMVMTYLDWLLDLPWDKRSEDQLDVRRAKAVLDEDHYDLDEVKERLIEHLAVRKRLALSAPKAAPPSSAPATGAMGAILCFVGPPGVGKTSLGQSIARALGRRFTRLSLGGMHDEAEIRGHRRTYIGARPGRIIQAIRRAGTRNPVFMLDEVDKIGSDWRGDPSSALLEVLDPAQNHTFRDYYLDVDFDLSDVLFITTANQLEPVPAPLQDRMEILRLDGYTRQEKIHIAQQFLVPRQLAANGLRPEELAFSEAALWKIVDEYTREAGVRELERQIGAICRKSLVALESGGETSQREGTQDLEAAGGTLAAAGPAPLVVTPALVSDQLGLKRYQSAEAEAIAIPGIAIGLAVTPFGGEILFIEATRMPGQGKLTLTGHLGEVMRESAQIAHSFIRANARQLDIDPRLFEGQDVHLHIPAGAIPKDGPSAGMAMTAAVASLFSGRPVRSEMGMSGEVTLRGRVLPVGGVKMKVLAARRAGLRRVLLPSRNQADVAKLPAEVSQGLELILIDRIEEGLACALAPSALG